MIPLFLLAAAARGEEIIDRNILTDETWTAAAGPYIIEKDPVEIKNGSTLTIEPGVEVRFEAGRSIETLVGSSIVAVGASGDSIRFMSNDPSPAEGDWTSVLVFSSPSSEFQYCVFTHGQYALTLTDSDTPVTRCAFRDCSFGIYMTDSSGTVSESSFRGCGEGLRLIRASPLIEKSWIAGSGSIGIMCYFDTSLPVVWRCNLVDNTDYNIQLNGYGDAVTVTAQENWWGSADENTIRATIRDAEDGWGDATVDYSGWLTDVPLEVRTWGAIKVLFK